MATVSPVVVAGVAAVDWCCQSVTAPALLAADLDLDRDTGAARGRLRTRACAAPASLSCWRRDPSPHSAQKQTQVSILCTCKLSILFGDRINIFLFCQLSDHRNFCSIPTSLVVNVVSFTEL